MKRKHIPLFEDFVNNIPQEEPFDKEQPSNLSEEVDGQNSSLDPAVQDVPLASTEAPTTDDFNPETEAKVS